MPAAYADLEMILRKRGEGAYSASFRYTSPDDAAEQSYPPEDSLALDPTEVKNLRGDDYAAALTKALFTEKVCTAFRESLNKPDKLRVRVTIEPSAPELHALHWETLQDPRTRDQPLFMGSNAIFSRFLASATDSKPVRLRPKADLTALVAVANPANLEDYGLDPVAVNDELLAAGAAMQGVALTELSSALAPEKAASLSNISAALRKGVDILYLVCHGTLVKDEPRLFLEDAKSMEGREFVQRIRELDQRPRLVVLASCRSAGVSGGSLSALGPRLAEAGVPAVIAMQGNVSMATIAKFMPLFFSELLIDGQIDRAMPVARGEVRDKHDYWMPALFMRLRNGRIWYVPGFDSEKSEFEQWESVCKYVRKGKCVPILGPDITESIYGSTRDLASSLAGEKFPLDLRDKSDLAKVSQYLLTQNSSQYARDCVREALEARLKSASERILNNLPATDPTVLLEQVAVALAAAEDDPLRILAGLDARVFITASSSELFSLILRQTPSAGTSKEPVEIAVRWRDERRDDQKEPEPVFEPSVDRPLLYYVFGKAPRNEDDNENADTWVLTEDDFFDYLIKTSRFKLMPSVVGNTLVTGSLLFLGFPLDDWKFRVLFRLIQAKGGSTLATRYNHVAVQVDPAETTLTNARRAKKYMEKYFGTSKIDIYWGTAADFLRDLNRQLKKAPAPVAAGGN